MVTSDLWLKVSAMVLLALVVTVVVVVAQQPHPCESPKQFEGRLSVFDYERKSQIFARFAYDDTNRRFRQIELEEFGKKHAFYDKLYLHNVGLEYKLDLRTRKCNVSTITWPFRPFAVPPDAKFAETVMFGAAGIPNEHVDLNRFEGDKEDRFTTSLWASLIPMLLSLLKNASKVEV